MKTTYAAPWGSDCVTVSADWAQASCPVEGDARGRQVADFRHSWADALRAALEDAAREEGLGEGEAEEIIDAAMREAEEL